MRIAINSRTSGKFEKRFLNNREHIVTKMVPIVGDSVMNKGFYPLTEVQNTFSQLHFLPAPNGHPKVNNELVSAFHPLAMNAFNIGGMVRNPKMDGNKVINEFWLDVDIANQSDDGQELIKRIENGEEVGVSTGLTVNRMPSPGEHDGQSYDWVAANMSFDHVAILLNEKAAGSHVGTALQANEDNTMVVNCAVLENNAEDSIVDQVISKMKGVFEPITNEITVDGLESQLRLAGRAVYPEATHYVWIVAVFPESSIVIFDVEGKTSGETHLIQYSYSIDDNDQVSLTGDGVIVVKKVEFVEVDSDVNITNSPMEGNTMSKEATQKEDVANSDDTTLNVESAINLLETKGFKVNTKEEADQLQFFLDNRDKFESIVNAEEADMKELRESLVANSDMTEDDVKGMSKDMLQRLSNSVTPAQNFAVNAGNGQRVASNGDISDDDFENSYTPNYEDTKGGE